MEWEISRRSRPAVLRCAFDEDRLVGTCRADMLASPATDTDRHVQFGPNTPVFALNHAHGPGRAVFGTGTAGRPFRDGEAVFLDQADLADLDSLLRLPREPLDRLRRAYVAAARALVSTEGDAKVQMRLKYT